MTNGEGRDRGRGRGSKHNSQPRSVLVSKALSRLLRHAAVEEHIPIDRHGYVRMDHVLGWQRLRAMRPPVTLDEVVEVVQENAKKRFALKYVEGPSETNTGTGTETETATERENENEPRSTPTQQTSLPPLESATATAAQAETEIETETETETQRAISIFQASRGGSSSHGNESLDVTVNVRRFLIRATQGHSMKTVEADKLLRPISVDDPASCPDTVVHGTFYGSWDAILQSGGLKRMARNHVHFATGPALDQVLPAAATTAAREGDTQHKVEKVGSMLGKNKVISGMRSDAQILIYIDIRKALTQRPDMKWWRSENGVILTEGVSPSLTSENKDRRQGEEEKNKKREEQEEADKEKAAETQQSGQETATAMATATASEIETKTETETEKLVPIEYWLAAVEVKEGLGLLWKQGEGPVRELPEHLRSRAPPSGKGGRHRGGGGGGGRGRGRGRGRG